jgi:hypothetical protein
MKPNFIHVTPVLSSSDIARDVKWYEEKLNFKYYTGQEGYAVLSRDNQWLHLQWHKGTEDDPIFGSVVKIFVQDIHVMFNEMVEKGCVSKDKLRMNTPWNTHEFGFYDLNKNAIFFVADAD